jgi:hypothetical protein
MDFMKTAWVYLWAAFAATEVGLTIWSHSAMFLWIASAAPVMAAYNLRRVRVGSRLWHRGTAGTPETLVPASRSKAA